MILFARHLVKTNAIVVVDAHYSGNQCGAFVIFLIIYSILIMEDILDPEQLLHQPERVPGGCRHHRHRPLLQRHLHCPGGWLVPHLLLQQVQELWQLQWCHNLDSELAGYFLLIMTPDVQGGSTVVGGYGSAVTYDWRSTGICIDEVGDSHYVIFYTKHTFL